MMGNVLENVREIVVSEGITNHRLNEALLMKKLGVSRSPVREALKHLEEEDLIERRQGAGIRLKTPSPKELVEIYDIRILLEGLAARYLTTNLNKTVLKNLKKSSREFSRLKRGKDDEGLRAADARFHRIIVKNCANQRLARLIDNLHLLTLGFKIAHQIPARITYQKVLYPHEKVVSAMESGNPVKAEEILRLHIEEGKNTLVKFLLGPGINLYPCGERPRYPGTRKEI